MAKQRIVAALAILALTAPHALAAPSVLGDWFTEDHRGVIHIGPCPAGGAICGTTVGMSDYNKDGSPQRDVNGVSECQLIIIKGMVPGDDDRLHGTVTDPRDGKVYQAQLWVGDDGALRLRGYIGLPLLGSTQRWEPFTGTRQADCHFRAG